MTIKIKTKENDARKNIRIRVIKAPLINTIELKELVYARSKATRLTV